MGRGSGQADPTCHTQEGTVPLREDIAPERWHPTPREYNHAISKLKRNKTADAGGWTTETAQSCMDHPHLEQLLLNWIHTHAIATSGPARRRGLWRTHRLVCLDKGGGAIRPILIGMIWAKLLSYLLLTAGQVRHGNLSPRQAIWNWHPPGGISDDYRPESAFEATPLPMW